MFAPLLQICVFQKLDIVDGPSIVRCAIDKNSVESGIFQQYTAKSRPAKRSTAEIGSAKIGDLDVALFKESSAEIRLSEVNATQPGVLEVGSS